MRHILSIGVLLTFACGPALALPLAPAPKSGDQLNVEKVANGCGPGMFRTIAGDCRRNRAVFVGPRRGVVAPPPCPRGYLRDPDPARPICYPAY